MITVPPARSTRRWATAWRHECRTSTRRAMTWWSIPSASVSKGDRNDGLAETPARAKPRITPAAGGAIRTGAVPRPGTAAAGGGQLRIPDFAGHGGPDQDARRSDLATVRAGPAGAGS